MLILGKDFAQIASVGAWEMQNILAQQNRLNDEIRHILQDYVRLNYATATAPVCKWHENGIVKRKKSAKNTDLCQQKTK